MITLFGSQFGLLYPALLAALPLLLGALIYAYLRRGRGQRLVVSSLLIFQQLQTRAAQRRRFFPPLRFFLELLSGRVYLLLEGTGSCF